MLRVILTEFENAPTSVDGCQLGSDSQADTVRHTLTESRSTAVVPDTSL